MTAPVLLLDVDGVLTDRDAVPDPEALALVASLARRGERIAFVTGRTRAWLTEKILTPLGESASRIACAAELGSVRGAGGSWEFLEVAGSEDVYRALHETVAALGIGDLVEVDVTKERIAAVEARHGDPSDHGHRARTRDALARLAEAVAQRDEITGWDVNPLSYAVDVVPPGLSKRVGAAWALQRLNARPDDEVWVLADSRSDVNMAHAAVDAGVETTFIWLGEADPPAAHLWKLEVASEPFARGTVSVLGMLA